MRKLKQSFFASYLIKENGGYIMPLTGVPYEKKTGVINMLHFGFKYLACAYGRYYKCKSYF